ncbi:hypothetical protein TWF718_005007 [Orbilia javanica]|uniref:Uncharacterized protein n=1 Tax=Orbilia javanica TaxID=47235 RepID=A0AAN8N3L7_9PEZI
MHLINLSAGTTIAFLASISQVSAHLRFYSAKGDANEPGTIGGALGHLYQIPVVNHGDHQHPGQWDTSVFSDPIVPACCSSPYKGKTRNYMEQGCGATLDTVFNHFAKLVPSSLTPPNYKGKTKLMWNHRNYHFFMRPPMPAGAYLQIKQEVEKEITNKRMAKATKGGWIEIGVWQVNSDGAGPYKCKLDTTGTGTGFPTNETLEVVTQPLGAPNSINHRGSSKHHLLKVNLPTEFDCAAKYNTTENICILRCENFARNGPFGGCVPFQLIYPKTETKPDPDTIVVNEPQPVPEQGDAGYDVGSDTYKEGSYGSESEDVI